MASLARLRFETALLSTGWASDVAIEVDGGVIRSVEAGGDGERVGGIAIPGAPNLHSHSFQRAMAGLAETRGPAEDSFWTWRQAMYRFVRALTPGDVEAIAALAFMEMLEGGFTSVAEFHYLHHAADGAPYTVLAEMALRIARAAEEVGIALTLLPVFYAAGGFGGAPVGDAQRRFFNSPERFLRLCEEARGALAGRADVVVGIALHSLRAVTPEGLDEVVGATPAGPIHIHVAEQVAEVEGCLAWSGQRPVAWLLAHQPVDARWCLIHATHTNAAELRGMGRSGLVVGLCPITEANLGDGIFDALKYRGAFGIGSDSNVAITAAGELQLLEYGQRLKHRARNVLAGAEGSSTGRALYDGMLAGGARALQRDALGVAVGQRADIVVLRRDHPGLAAASGDGVLDAYIFSAGRAAIDSVFVSGRRVVSEGKHPRREEIIARYSEVVRRIGCLDH